VDNFQRGHGYFICNIGQALIAQRLGLDLTSYSSLKAV
jgi:hypothetical protein